MYVEVHVRVLLFIKRITAVHLGAMSYMYYCTVLPTRLFLRDPVAAIMIEIEFRVASPKASLNKSRPELPSAALGPCRASVFLIARMLLRRPSSACSKLPCCRCALMLLSPSLFGSVVDVALLSRSACVVFASTSRILAEVMRSTPTRSSPTVERTVPVPPPIAPPKAEVLFTNDFVFAVAFSAFSALSSILTTTPRRFAMNMRSSPTHTTSETLQILRDMALRIFFADARESVLTKFIRVLPGHTHTHTSWVFFIHVIVIVQSRPALCVLQDRPLSLSFFSFKLFPCGTCIFIFFCLGS